MGTDIDAETIHSTVWRLDARPADLTAAAVAWRALATRVHAVADRIRESGSTLLGGWHGEAATAYATHHERMVGAVATVGSVATGIAAVVDEAALTLHHAQDHLDDGWRRLARVVPATDGVFHPGDEGQTALVRAAIREARAVRSDADTRLAVLAAQVERLRHGLDDAAGFTVLADGVDPWPVPAELGPPGQVLVVGDRVIISGGGSGDLITIGVDGAGRRVVTVDGERRVIPPGLELVVRGGGGDDVLVVEAGTVVRVTLIGGAGDDDVFGADGPETILGLWGDDTIEAGGGGDAVMAGSGRDYVDGGTGADDLRGGAGDDTLYGGAGRDRLDGGRGRDYLDGGTGADALTGGSGDDVVHGGRGPDRVHGGAGDDVLTGGDGTDTVLGGAGADRSFTQVDDSVAGVAQDVRVELTDVGGFIRVEGSDAFVARVASDLDALRASVRGQHMLAALQEARDTDAGNTLVIRETTVRNGITFAPHDGEGVVVAYNPTFDDFDRSPPVPPTVVLFHELAHVYDLFHDTVAPGEERQDDGTMARRAEREAVGLPIDHDGNPFTPARQYPAHPADLTENGLREEYGRNLRTTY
jgi:uncharacterized protein YukE